MGLFHTGAVKSIILLLLILLSGCSRALPVWGTVPDFSMTDQSSRPFAKKDLQGRVWIADFIYTGCGTACPMLTQKMSQLQKNLRGGEDVRFVSFTVDPERDTPERLAEYSSRFGADPDRWRFLSGPIAVVQKTVTDGFKLSMAPAEGSSDIFHSEKFVLVDRLGRIRGYYDADTEGLKRIAKDLEALRKEKP